MAFARFHLKDDDDLFPFKPGVFAPPPDPASYVADSQMSPRRLQDVRRTHYNSDEQTLLRNRSLEIVDAVAYEEAALPPLVLDGGASGQAVGRLRVQRAVRG